MCDLYEVFHRFINNLERLSGRLVRNVQHCFVVIIVEEPSTKIEVSKFKFAKQGYSFCIIILINTTIRPSFGKRLVAQEHQGR